MDDRVRARIVTTVPTRIMCEYLQTHCIRCVLVVHISAGTLLMTLQEKRNVETMNYFIRLYIIMRVCECVCRVSMLFQLWLHNISPSSCNNGIQFMDRMCEATLLLPLSLSRCIFCILHTQAHFIHANE